VLKKLVLTEHNRYSITLFRVKYVFLCVSALDSFCLLELKLYESSFCIFGARKVFPLNLSSSLKPGSDLHSSIVATFRAAVVTVRLTSP